STITKPSASGRCLTALLTGIKWKPCFKHNHPSALRSTTRPNWRAIDAQLMCREPDGGGGAIVQERCVCRCLFTKPAKLMPRPLALNVIAAAQPFVEQRRLERRVRIELIA